MKHGVRSGTISTTQENHETTLKYTGETTTQENHETTLKYTGETTTNKQG